MDASNITTHFTSYAEAVAYLQADYIRLPQKLFDGPGGLRTAALLLNELHNPQSRYPAIHIAATSGKGTVAMMLNALLKASGLKVGLTVSPHVYDMRERYQIDGQLAPEADVLAAINEIMPYAARHYNSDMFINYFILQLALAFMLFANAKVDMAVLETGLGGLLDATNLARPEDKICLLGRIGLDHQDILGNTIEAIATQKAGIVKPGNIVFALEQSESVNAIFQNIAVRQGASLQFVRPLVGAPYTGWLAHHPQLGGPHQAGNLALALATYHYILQQRRLAFDQSIEESAISRLYLPGRFEPVNYNGTLVIYDGAHNQQKTEALCDSMRERYANRKFILIFATNRPEEAGSILRLLEPFCETIVLTRYEILQETAHKAAFDFSEAPPKLSVPLVVINNRDKLGDFIKHQTGKSILVTGSFYLLQATRRLIEQTLIKP